MFNFELDTAAAMDNNFGGKGFKTGITKAKVLNVFTGKSTGGNQTVDIEIENENGGRAFIFGLKTDKLTAAGKTNYDYAKFMEFALATGVRTGAEGIGERKLNGSMQQVPTLSEPKGKQVFVALQQTFGVNNRTNKETIMWSLVKTFTAEGLSIRETQDGKPAAEMDAFTVNDYYTKEWIAADEDGTLIKENGNNSSAPANDGGEAAPAGDAKPGGKLF